MEKWVQTKDFKVKRGELVLNIGDYIDYHDQAGENSKDLYEGRWQVLGTDYEGRLLIVSESNVTTHYFNKENTLEGAMEAYSTGVDTLNKICVVYAKGKGAVSARSIQIEDVDRLTGYDKTTDSEYGKSYTYYNEEGNKFIWYNDGKWSSTCKKENITLTNSYYVYKINLLKSKVNNMLLGKNKEKSYWLASPYVNARNNNARFGSYLISCGSLHGNNFVYSSIFNYGTYYGVRVVVVLKPDIRITPKHIIVIE